MLKVVVKSNKIIHVHEIVDPSYADLQIAARIGRLGLSININHSFSMEVQLMY